MDLAREPEAFVDPHAAASNAGLRYASDEQPGISRRRRGKAFSYFRPGSKVVKDAATLARIRRLAIPPAWTDVWIAPDPKGHLAATGRDVKGRKQYRYNPEFIQARDAAKYEHVIAFASQLPALRKRVSADMAKPGLSREKVLATIVHLLESTNSRIGNETYARDNKSFGLTTLRNRHVRVRGSELKFEFKGKSGKSWHFNVQSKRVAKVIRACQDLPGQHLFEYRDDEGNVHKVGSADVNAYLQELTGRDITAKDFRTWAGTMEAALALHAFVGKKLKPSKVQVRAALEQAAKKLGNTVAICRKCYVHPEIIASYERGDFLLRPMGSSRGRRRHSLGSEERAVLTFLKANLISGKRRNAQRA